jgi:hypothetical protein
MKAFLEREDGGSAFSETSTYFYRAKRHQILEHSIPHLNIYLMSRKIFYKINKQMERNRLEALGINGGIY